MDDAMEEGVGESSWPPSASTPGVWKEIHDRLVEPGNEEAISDPSSFRKLLDQHFERLPASYSIDLLHVDKAEDVLLHRRILAECADPDKRPIFHVRFLKCIQDDKPQGSGSLPSNSRDGKLRELEPYERKMEELSLERGKGVADFEAIFSRRDMEILRVHEIIFSSVDKPKLLSKLSALLSEVGLNIREAHVFSTTDGFSLHVFVVDGWDTEETDGLLQRLKETAARSHPSLSNPTNSSALESI